MDNPKSFAAIDNGKVDFTLADSDTAIWITRNQLKNASVAFPVGPTDKIGWAFRKEDKDLQAVAQQFFNEQRKDESSPFNQSWIKHFGITLPDFKALIESTQ